MADRMKVTVTLVVEFDPKAWADAQGREGVWTEDGKGYNPAGVRQDVRDYVLNLVQNSVMIDEEASGTVTLK